MNETPVANRNSRKKVIENKIVAAKPLGKHTPVTGNTSPKPVHKQIEEESVKAVQKQIGEEENKL